jgi:polyferredoxin
LTWNRINKKSFPQDWLKLIGGIIFLPVLLLPALRCYFKVPYVFCRSCPDKCPWGLSRTFILSTFTTLNFSEKFWCNAVCPIGTFQECQAGLSMKKLKTMPWLSWISYAILFFTAWLYLLTLSDSSSVELFAKGSYVWATVSVSAASLILLAAFFVPKFLCRYFCPIGIIANLSFWFKNLFKKKFASKLRPA